MEKIILDIITIIVLGSWVVIHIRYIHKMEQEIETQNNLIESQKELVNALFKVWARERRENAVFIIILTIINTAISTAAWLTAVQIKNDRRYM